MSLRIELGPRSPWAPIRERFGSPELGFDATITDTDDAHPGGPRLLLHRAPRTPDEVGFFLADCHADLVEISPAPDTARATLSRAWEVARSLGLAPIRLAEGEASLLARLRPLATGGDVPARLAVAAAQALESGVAGPDDVERLLGFLRPGAPTVFAELNRTPGARREERLDRARRELGLAHLPPALRRELRSGTPLAERRVELVWGEGIARLRLVRPRALNALDPEMLTELDALWARAEREPGTRAIVLEGAGPAFMAGVDLDRILTWMESDHFGRIEDFVRRAHRFLDRVDRCPHHTMVRLHGLAVGAGAEFCAAFDTVVASRQGSVGFPELSLGIYPAMGGTQRLPRRIGFARARWWILQGALLPASRAAELGLVDVVVEEQALDEEIRRRSQETGPFRRAARRERAPAGGDGGWNWWAGASLDELLDPAPDDPPAAVRLARTLRRRSPVAVARADALLRLSRDRGLGEGLAAEIAGLRSVYPTDAALRGIRAALHRTGRSRPG